MQGDTRSFIVREGKIWLLLAAGAYGAGYIYYNYFKEDKDNATKPDENTEKILQMAKKLHSAGEKRAALSAYKDAANSLIEAGLGLHHMAFQVNCSIALLCEELGDKKGEFMAYSKALDINSRLLQRWEKSAKEGTMTKEGEDPQSGVMSLKIERAILVDFLAQKKQEEKSLLEAEKLYRQGLLLLLEAPDDVVEKVRSPPKLSPAKKKLWVNTLCGILNNMGSLYLDQGRLEDAYKMYVGATVLAANSNGDVSEDKMHHADSMLTEVKAQIGKPTS